MYGQVTERDVTSRKCIYRFQSLYSIIYGKTTFFFCAQLKFHTYRSRDGRMDMEGKRGSCIRTYREL